MVLAADAVTGQTTPLHTERDDAWVELAPGTPARTSAGDLVTVSDRDGSRRLVVGGAAVTPDGLHIDWVSGTDGEATGAARPAAGRSGRRPCSAIPSPRRCRIR
jgi:dipeptidyl-peptidase-4